MITSGVSLDYLSISELSLVLNTYKYNYLYKILKFIRITFNSCSIIYPNLSEVSISSMKSSSDAIRF